MTVTDPQASSPVSRSGNTTAQAGAPDEPAAAVASPGAGAVAQVCESGVRAAAQTSEPNAGAIAWEAGEPGAGSIAWQARELGAGAVARQVGELGAEAAGRSVQEAGAGAVARQAGESASESVDTLGDHGAVVAGDSGFVSPVVEFAASASRFGTDACRVSEVADEAAVECETPGGRWQPFGAGVVAAMVGFISTFAVVLTGLSKVGATPAQAASGLAAICLAQAVGMLVLARRYRMPIALAWSTPGAALLASTGVVSGGWPAAVGAFLVAGALIVLTGFWQRLGRLIAAIPAEIAQAMLAGVLLPLCLAPVHALKQSPAVVVPVIVVWLIVQRYAARWAVPAAFVTAVLGAGIEMTLGHRRLDLAAMVPRVEPTLPHWSWQAMIGIAVPLYIVTMAGQNIPGTAVMESFGYRVPWRAAMATTGLGTVLAAPLGGHAINLAAVTAALTAGPSVHPDPRRRWVSVVGTGISYLVLAMASAALVVLVAAAPRGVLETVAGLALIGTFAAALAAALGPFEHRIAGASTFLVAASGFAVFGVGAAFWGLVAGLLVRWALSARHTSGSSPVRGESN